jgi:hypothetical protein
LGKKEKKWYNGESHMLSILSSLIFEKITRKALFLAKIFPHSTRPKENFGEKPLSQAVLFQKSAYSS